MNERTPPKLRNVHDITDRHLLAGGRYGTRETCDEWGDDATTFRRIMDIGVARTEIIRDIYPGKLSPAHVNALVNAANLEAVNPDRVRELEAKTGHDVIAVTKAWGEAADKLCPGTSSIVGITTTSADSTESAKAYRCKFQLENVAYSLENLRDIALETSVGWKNVPHMDQSHLYDALPTFAGRPLSFFAEMLQSDLDWIKYVHDNSLYVKWADATGNHHSAESFGMDGQLLQKKLAKRLGLKFMNAPAQIPGREFNSDVMYALARSAGSVANLARYVRTNRGDDADLYILDKPEKAKGSLAMAHKDAKGGNPTAEEQAGGIAKKLYSSLGTAMNNIVFDYARDLEGSLPDRLDIADGFRLVDHAIRRMAAVVYYLKINEARSEERVARSHGVVTSQRVMNYLLKQQPPMSRMEAHDLLGELATSALAQKRSFYDVLSEDRRITSRIPDLAVLKELSNPLTYTGESSRIIEVNYDVFHGKRTFS